MRISLIIYSLCLLPTFVVAQIDIHKISPKSELSAADITPISDDTIGDLVSTLDTKNGYSNKNSESAEDTIHSFEQYNTNSTTTSDENADDFEDYQTGEASWYGKRFHGRKTASGEIYNMHNLTAAHRKLPLGSRIRVTNLHNDKSVIVRVTDRGPYAKGRIVDLSYAAAKELEFVHRGHTRVKIELAP